MANFLVAQTLPDAKEPTVHFADVTDSAGITFRHNSAPEKKYIVESIGCSVPIFG